MKPSGSVRPHQATLLIAGLATVVGYLIPVLRQVLLPVVYLNTHLHEFSHALVAKLTGASVQQILVNANGSGETPVAGGNMLLIASAGYVGASIFGALMIYFGRAESSARITLLTLAVILTFSMALWVRGDTVGVISGIAWIIVLAAMAFGLKGKPLTFCCQFLGLQQCLNSVLSLFVLVQISTSVETHSDASILQDATHIPALVWATAWSLFSLALVGWALHKSWQQPRRRA